MRHRPLFNRVIRCLLALYPDAWRRRYGKEFGALLEDEPLGMRALLDVASHCLRQRFSPDVPKDSGGLRLTSDGRFRFPRAIVVLMAITFSGVVIAIRIASSAAGDTSGEAWKTLGSVLLLMLLTMCAAGAIAQGILRCLRRK